MNDGSCPRRLMLLCNQLCGTLGKTVGLELQASIFPLYPQTAVRNLVREDVT